MTSKFPPVDLPASPFARALQAYCLSLPGAHEDYPWSDVVFKVGAKMFAGLGGDEVNASVTVKATHPDADVLVEMPHIRRAAYVGRFGWVTVEIRDGATLSHAKELIAESYRLIAPKRKKAPSA